ncbi:MAG TPA: hypothetical protein VL651_06010 [Bacteroidia bacterium]|jgi:hypothetical protein|nr:hypothetical protein [Bacteroidia bacterium]
MKTSKRVTRFAGVTATLLVAILFLGFRSTGNAVRAKWNCFVVHNADGQADIHFTAEIPGGWKMFSQKMAGVDGPLATSIEFDPDPAFQVVGQPTEAGKEEQSYQPELGMEVSSFENTVQYVQHITFTEDKAFAVKCLVNYMLFRDGEILPPDDEDFTISIVP